MQPKDLTRIKSEITNNAMLCFITIENEFYEHILFNQN